jgi:CelD/BcsL family acetyltransferase involved in cellulose biosynthesis
MIFVPALEQSHSIKTIEDIDGLRGLQTEWEQAAPFSLVEPWQSFSWMESAAAAYSTDHLFRVLTVRKNGELTGVAPLVLKRSEQPLKPWRLDFLGAEELKEPNRLIAKDPVSMNLLLDRIASERVYPLRLSRIPVQNAMADHVEAKFKKSGWITRMMSMPYPFLDLTGDPIKKSLRQDLRRARRRAEKYGPLRLEVVGRVDRQELLKHLQTGFQIEASGWKGRNRTAILASQARRDFFERYALGALNQDSLRLCFLMFGAQAVAVQYAVESMDSYWLLNIGYEEKYRECSPGNLLLEESIKIAEANNLVHYNFLGKEEPWTRRWTTTVQDCMILAAYRPNWYGLKAMMSDALYMFFKKRRDRKAVAQSKIRSV